MKLIVVALLWMSACAHAALFDFSTRSKAPTAPAQSSTWAVDLATGRQWYLAWAASADRVYQRMINPGVTIASAPAPGIPTQQRIFSRTVYTGIFALVAAALISGAKSVSKTVQAARRELAQPAR
jgi:hypothetical protein